MASRKVIIVVAVSLIWLASPSASEEKADKAAAAKTVAETFAKEFIEKRDVSEATKLIAVPFLEITDGMEETLKKMEKSEDVEKQLRNVVKRHPAMGIRGKVKIERVEETGLPLRGEAPKDVFNPKTDRVFVISFTQDPGFPFALVTLVGWRKDQPKVIGYGLYFSR